MKLSKILATAAAASILASSSATFAGSSTGTLSVTANVIDSCTVSAGTLAFGNYDPTAGSDVTASSPLSVTCSFGTLAAIRLGQGSHAGSGSTDAAPVRRLTDGSNHFLSYSLFQDTTRLIGWGNTTLTSKGYLALSNAATNVHVYGTLPAGQNAAPGSYTDSIVVTIAF